MKNLYPLTILYILTFIVVVTMVDSAISTASGVVCLTLVVTAAVLVIRGGERE